jgi:hypothetical protein
LEKKNAQYAKMCVRNDEWLCARDQEIQRLDAALGEIKKAYVAYSRADTNANWKEKKDLMDAIKMGARVND